MNSPLHTHVGAQGGAQALKTLGEIPLIHPDAEIRMTDHRVKSDIQRVLPYISAEECRELLVQLADENVDVVQEPQAGLMMMTIRDSADSDFFLGEALVTTAEVRRQGRLAQGRIMGDEPVKALLLATVEAVVLSEDHAGIGRIRERLEGWEQKAEDAMATEASLAASTRVSFDSMTAETTDFGTIGQE